MRRFALLTLLLAALLGMQAVAPRAANAWGCGAGPPQCTYGGPNSQCDSICGPGLGVCDRPGCCFCIA